VWVPTFTQEWPVVSQTHQFSYTLSWLSGHGTAGFGDTLINYRYQALTEGPGRPAFSPRVSLVVPTGSSDRGLGAGSAGLQFNLPFSKQSGDISWHWNAGLTWLTSVDGAVRPQDEVSLASPFLAASGIYRVRPMFHLMVESVANFEEYPQGEGTARETFLTLSPGARGGWNIGDRQLILGFAVPVTWGGETEGGAFFYLSYELPFKR
jgi:hypothetical protein